MPVVDAEKIKLDAKKDAPSNKPQELPRRYYFSPVDYEAWARGYQPPEDHRLIDALMFRGARPVCSASRLGSEDGEWWLVTRGFHPGSKIARKLFEIMALLEDGEPSCSSTAAYSSGNEMKQNP